MVKYSIENIKNFELENLTFEYKNITHQFKFDEPSQECKVVKSYEKVIKSNFTKLLII